jgi:hypothetical protein
MRDIFAKLRTDEHSEYEFIAEKRPLAPMGYEGEWFITGEDPPRLEFIGRPNLVRLYEEDLPEWEKRD